VQSASAVYSFPNVKVDNNKIELFYQSAGPPGTNTIGFSLTVVPGLYATLLELQHGIANAAIAAQVHKSNPAAPVTTVEDFTTNYDRLNHRHCGFWAVADLFRSQNSREFSRRLWTGQAIARGFSIENREYYGRIHGKSTAGMY
jgi:hypothetical protein